jgi:predicted nucleic-acid-binding Zn-ribbon protein
MKHKYLAQRGKKYNKIMEIAQCKTDEDVAFFKKCGYTEMTDDDMLEIICELHHLRDFIIDKGDTP